MKQPPYKYMVRLPAQMREMIAESARHYRRSMNSDIVARLQNSFSGLPNTSEEKQLSPLMHHTFEDLFRRELSEDEEQLLRGYRRLSAAKQRALLDLLV